MPLRRGNKARSAKGIGKNISQLRKDGYPQKQSIAIAMRLAGKRKKRK